MATGLLSPLLVAMLGFLLHVHVARAGLEHTCTLETRLQGAHPRGICGSKLPNIVHTVCQVMGRGYAGGQRQLRKRTSIIDSDDMEADEGSLGGFMMSKRRALSYLQKETNPLVMAGYERRGVQKRHGDQGITCECCYNFCSFRELVQYCN
nr:hormone insulin-related peptide [Conus ebraeus]